MTKDEILKLLGDKKGECWIFSNLCLTIFQRLRERSRTDGIITKGVADNR